MHVRTEGEFAGLGIRVTQEDGLIKVVNPIEDAGWTGDEENL